MEDQVMEDQVMENQEEFFDDEFIEEPSEGEESTDSEAAKEVACGFIVNEDEEEEEEVKEVEKKKKTPKRRRHESGDLSEDDLDLIEENTGLKVARKFKRLKRGVRKPSNDVKNISNEGVEKRKFKRLKRGVRKPSIYVKNIFNKDDEDVRKPSNDVKNIFNEDEDDDEKEVLKEDEEDFVVNDDGEGFIEDKRHAPTLFQEVFHDLEEKYTFAFDKIEDLSDFNIETLEKVFSPEAYLTRKDKTIKVSDLPERFQLRPDIVVNRSLTKEEIKLAANIITKSIADYNGISGSLQLFKAVKNVLKFFSQNFLEVPYIWTYEKDSITNYEKDSMGTKDPIKIILSRADLWHIFDLEYDFRKFIEMKDQINSEISKKDSYVDRILSEARIIEELYDLNMYVNFQKKKKTIMFQQVSPMSESRRKGSVSKNVKYLEYIYRGFLKVVDKFGIQIPLFAQSLDSEMKLHRPINENLTPLEVIQQLYPESKTPNEILNQSIELLAYEISIDPMFRKFVRNNFMKYGLLVTSGPLKVISNDDESWSYCFWKIPIQKAFNIGGKFAQLLHYKNQNLIDISFKLRNEEKFLEMLKNNIVSDDKTNINYQWNKYRIDAVLKAYNDILRPNIESWLISKFKVNAEQWIMEQCMLNLERKIDVKPFRTSEMRKSEIPRVFALSFGAGGWKDYTCCVYVDEHGKKAREWSWATLKNPNSEEGNEFLRALNKFKPRIVVVRCYNSKTKFLLNFVKNFVDYYNEKLKNKSEKITVVVTDDKVAMEYSTLEISKMEYPNSSELSRYCTSLARMVQNPLMEHLRLGDTITSIKFHPLQSFLPEEKLKEALDRAFVNVVNEMGVDINDILKDEFNLPKQRTLHYICGFGPRKSIYLKQLIFGENYNPNFDPFIDSRSTLKDYLEQKVFQNSVGFLRIHPDPKEPLDDSRIHPDFYDLAHKYRKSTHNMDVRSNHNKFLMKLINEENSDPFGDKRRDYEIPTFDQVFEIVTKETESSLHSGLIVPVVIKKITTGALKVSLKNSGFECNIGWNHMDKKVKNNNIEEGKTINALVKFINKESFTIVLSCKREDLETGHYRSFHDNRFDKFIDREAKKNYRFPIKGAIRHK